jgi:hypothetical protein
VVLQNNGDRFAKSGDGELGLFAQHLAVPVIDENGAATGGMGAIYVAPAIADHPARGKLDVESRRGALKHARLGLAALTRLAMLCTRVKTNFKTIEDWDQFRQPLINGLNKLACLFSPPDVGLVGDDDEAESSLLELLAARDGIRRKLQLFRRVRRIGHSISDNGLIKDAVPIQEDATVCRGDH